MTISDFMRHPPTIRRIRWMSIVNLSSSFSSSHGDLEATSEVVRGTHPETSRRMEMTYLPVSLWLELGRMSTFPYFRPTVKTPSASSLEQSSKNQLKWEDVHSKPGCQLRNHENHQPGGFSTSVIRKKQVTLQREQRVIREGD